MKEFELKDLKYEDLQSPLIKGVYFDILCLGKEVLNIRDSSKYVPALNFEEPEFLDSMGDFIIIKFDNEDEINKPISYLLNNSKYISSDYNYIKICDSKTNLTEEEFNQAKEDRASEEIFNPDYAYLEHVEDFKNEIFMKYFEKDIDYILKDMRESIEYNDLENFNKRKEEFENVIKQLDNVNFYSKYSVYKESVDFSEYIEKDDSINEIKKLINFQKLREMSLEEFSDLNEVSAEAGDFDGSDIFYTNNKENIQVFIHLNETNRTIEEYCNDKELMQELKNLTLKAYQDDLNLKIQEFEIEEEMEL